MKRINVVSLLTVLGLSILTGCTDNHVENEAKQLVKNEVIKVSDPIFVGTNENYKVPFKISGIKSVFVNLNDSASEALLRGVRYEVACWLKKKYQMMKKHLLILRL